MGGQEASENKTRAVNERRLRREVEGTDSQVFHHQGATAPGGFGPGGPAARVLQDDGDCVGRLKGEGAGVGGVVGDERGDALEDDPLVGGRPVDEVRAEEESAISRGDGGGQPADVARLRWDAEPEELYRGEGVVHHDGDVEGRATPAVALGQHVREVRAEEADEVDVADPAA